MRNEEFNLEKEDQLLHFVLNKFGQEVFTPGFDRILPLFEKSINYSKKRKLKIVTIGGTNGKGQTAHTLCDLLSQQKINTALWTSPHILSIKERFIFSQKGELQQISYEELDVTFKAVDLELRESFPLLKISFYEFLFLVFWKLVLEKNEIDVVILEVGLGGKLDAVNLFDASLAALCSISRDHQAILGNRYDLILHEKLPIARRGHKLFTNFKLDYLNELTRKYCQAQGVLWENVFDAKTAHYYEANQKLAMRLFKELLLEQSLPQSVENLIHFNETRYYKGRREIMTFNGKSLIFIGAHNTDGIRAMVELLKKESQLKPQSLLISFSKRPDEEIRSMINSLREYFTESVPLNLTYFNHPKAMEKKKLMEMDEEYKGNLHFVSDWKTFLLEPSLNFTEEKILVCGSYYFIGEIQRFIMSNSH